MWVVGKENRQRGCVLQQCALVWDKVCKQQRPGITITPKQSSQTATPGRGNTAAAQGTQRKTTHGLGGRGRACAALGETVTTVI